MNSKEINKLSKEINILSDDTFKYLQLVSPAYTISPNNIEQYLEDKSSALIKNMTFYKIVSCTTEEINSVGEELNEKIEKLFISLNSLAVPITYGIISQDGIANIVIGVLGDSDNVKSITEGCLTGIELEHYRPEFVENVSEKNYYGLLAGIPTINLDGEKQKFSISSILRTLNGKSYTLLFLAKPIPRVSTENRISSLINIRDRAFALSKQTMADSFGTSNSKTVSTSNSESESISKANMSGHILGGLGAAGGAAIGSVVPVIGTATGMLLGGLIGNALGIVAGAGKTESYSTSRTISESIGQTISENKSISRDIQNGFALELVSYADTAINRMKIGRSCGMWEVSIAYSALSLDAKKVIEACLVGELSKPSIEQLPMITFTIDKESRELIQIPRFLNGYKVDSYEENPLCSSLTSTELGLLCTLPTESVPDFEVRYEKSYPLVRSSTEKDDIKVGYLLDGSRVLNNMPFTFSKRDLNKHTFICGLTGSGKTTTVKKILHEAGMPFLVIESAKKEYRSFSDVDINGIYTMGNPQLNCPQINPFYIMPGVNLQSHIDLLKDLFNASFGLYGPMPYILEKCLYSIYQKKGWDLTLGCHPLLVNLDSELYLYDEQYIFEQYQNSAHRYLFPTMQDLKNEIIRYIEDELEYKGEILDNIKSAMLVRIENLCYGPKGYTFNTSECINFDELLNKRVVFELEDLADDADKAFGVGLLIIFVNEYRKIKKELQGFYSEGLQHLLVIEEAHRLLKNTVAEVNSEFNGNAKGKAVEHFVNILAEMRSYGQGVIVAEQIPSKLASDVIKNSSNKVVQRLVSKDDQNVMANTIGMLSEDAIQLGTLKSGYGYCHREGMSNPTRVKIENTIVDESGDFTGLNRYITDEDIYNYNYNRFNLLNLSIVTRAFDDDIKVQRLIIAFFNTTLVESKENIKLSIEEIFINLVKIANRKSLSLLFCDNIRILIRDYLFISILKLLVTGIYSVKQLPSDDLASAIKDVLNLRTDEAIVRLKNLLEKSYKRDILLYGRFIVMSLIAKDKIENLDLMRTIDNYFIVISKKEKSRIYRGLMEIRDGVSEYDKR